MEDDLEEACARLESTLEAATTARPGSRILLMIHYPPRWAAERTPTAFERVIGRFPVDLVLYGHIHGPDLAVAHDGPFDVGGRSIRYLNASCDRTDMRPIEVLRLSDRALLLD